MRLKSELQHQTDLKTNLVAHCKYLSMIATINKGLLNKKNVALHHCGFKVEFRKHFY